MTPRRLLLAVALWSLPAAAPAAYPPLDHWYSNPLGFSPIALHTGNALWLPALAAERGRQWEEIRRALDPAQRQPFERLVADLEARAARDLARQPPTAR